MVCFYHVFHSCRTFRPRKSFDALRAAPILADFRDHSSTLFVAGADAPARPAQCSDAAIGIGRRERLNEALNPRRGRRRPLLIE